MRISLDLEMKLFAALKHTSGFAQFQCFFYLRSYYDVKRIRNITSRPLINRINTFYILQTMSLLLFLAGTLNY